MKKGELCACLEEECSGYSRGGRRHREERRERQMRVERTNVMGSSCTDCDRISFQTHGLAAGLGPIINGSFRGVEAREKMKDSRESPSSFDGVLVPSWSSHSA